MSADTDWVAIANTALAHMLTNKRKKHKKSRMVNGLEVNPQNVETRFGVLLPFGGPMGGGASVPSNEDSDGISVGVDDPKES